MEAINHPAGDLAQFWTQAVQWEWTQAGDEWGGLTDELTSELDRMVSADDRNGLLASTFLASQLHFYFAADQVWASSRLLPLFDWSDDERRARGAWQGFLTGDARTTDYSPPGFSTPSWRHAVTRTHSGQGPRTSSAPNLRRLRCMPARIRCNGSRASCSPRPRTCGCRGLTKSAASSKNSVPTRQARSGSAGLEPIGPGVSNRHRCRSPVPKHQRWHAG